MKVYKLGDYESYSFIRTNADVSTVERTIELVKEAVEDYSDQDVVNVLTALGHRADILNIEATINF